MGYRLIDETQYRLLAQDLIGRQLVRNEDVHHIDFNHNNNDPGNLLVCTRRDHQRIHAGQPLPDLNLSWLAPVWDGKTIDITYPEER